jgi:hypothetical protein
MARYVRKPGAYQHFRSRYGIACVGAHLLQVINPNSKWKVCFKALIKEFTKSEIVSLKSAGFPDD